MTIPLQRSIVYGPIKSRRFGNSLGINLLPTEEKICTFDCFYCQYGETAKGPAVFPTLEVIDREIDAVFSDTRDQNMRMDWITIAGNGEPTLHPDFTRVVDRVLQYRDQYLYKVPVGILSNSSTCFRPEIRSALLKLDGRFMKLDAGNLELFNQVNRPVSLEDWNRILRGLRDLKNCVLQSMFIRGRIDNTRPKDVEDWVQRVETIRPQAVQIYTTARSTRDTGILPVPRERLEEIAGALRDQTNIPAEIYI
jgi:wyosine [tRNA(Phe)-imidazoG37] synthetase (radical SAM superfamily)